MAQCYVCEDAQSGNGKEQSQPAVGKCIKCGEWVCSFHSLLVRRKGFLTGEVICVDCSMKDE